MPATAQYLPDQKTKGKDKGKDFSVIQCSFCGLVQLNSDHVPYYREVIRAAGFSREMNEFRSRQFSEFVKEYSLKGKKIVEIGCGQGEYLSLLKKSGLRASGLEFGSNSIKKCQKQGLDVAKGFVNKENYRIKSSPFDAFFMLSFLEHLPEPGKVLKGIHGNLSDNAVGIIEVPNFDMIQRDGLMTEFMSDHLMYFTKDTLSIALKMNGFEIIKCQEVCYDYIISATIIKRKRIDANLFLKQKEKIQREIEKFIKLFRGKKIAVWGAGHQALAAMSLFGMSGKIDYVIDSAPFKQGKLTPATHIPIVAPEKLFSDPVDALLVIAGSYSEEIIKIASEKFLIRNLAVLRNNQLELVRLKAKK